MIWRFLATHAAYVALFAMPLVTRAEAGCRQPDLDSFLEDSRFELRIDGAYFPAAVAHLLPFQVGDRTLQWFGVGWEGPKGGALFVLDCSGRRVAMTPLGYILHLSKGPVLAQVGPTVQVLYITGVATSYQIERVAIVAFQNNALKSFWSHTAREGIFAPMEDGTETEYQWRLSEDGQRIWVEGSRQVYPKSKRSDQGWGAPTSHKLPPEIFCWNRQGIVYIACPPH
jgi:hypothetical protein